MSHFPRQGTPSVPPCSACAAAELCPAGVRPSPWGEGVRALMKPGVFGKGEVLLAAGEVSQVFRFIKTGLVVMRQQGPDGVDRPIGLVGRGFMTGQMGLHGLPSLIRFEAAGVVGVCEVEHPALRRLGSLDERGANAVVAFNVKAMRALVDWSQVMRERSLHRRLAIALVLMARDQGTVRIQLPGQRLLAELLAVTRESVGRALDDLCAWGLIGRVGRAVVEVDEAALADWFVTIKRNLSP